MSNPPLARPGSGHGRVQPHSTQQVGPDSLVVLPVRNHNAGWERLEPSANAVGLAGPLPSRSDITPSSFSIGLSIDTEEIEPKAGLAGDGSMQMSTSSVMSGSSSVYPYVEEFGRTFHRYKQGKYYMPNDEEEQSRLDLQHAISLKLLDGKLHLAPLKDPQKVLDVGTGTGVWAIDFSEEYPDAEVLGTDLSPIQRDYAPPHLRFEIGDAEDEWDYDRPFDYIHGRYMCPFISDPAKLFRRAYENLAPGGWVEFMEVIIYWQAIDDSLKGRAVKRWNDLLLEGIQRMGRDALSGLAYKRHMADAGLVNVVEKKFALPTSPWAKGKEEKFLGALQQMNTLQGIEAITTSVFSKGLGWTSEQIDEFLVEVKKDVADKRIHSFIPIVVVYAQKPL